MNDKTRILVWSDYAAFTGFGIVMSHIIKRLPPEEFEIDVCAINYFGNPDYDRERFPGRIWPALSHVIPPYDDVLGRQKVIDLAREHNYDTIFILQDIYNATSVINNLLEVRRLFQKRFRIVYYFPIDAPAKKNWITESAGQADTAVTYTQYAKEICTEAGVDEVQIIPHGIDTDDFYPIDDHDEVESFRNFWFPGASGKVLLVNVNRNQPRKDIPRSLLVLRELKDHFNVDASLYLHCSTNDVSGDFSMIAAQLGLQRGTDYFLPANQEQSMAIEYLNLVYNAADVLITTSLGEGWGLSLTEAMATKTLVVAPDHTSITEILDRGKRGLLVKAGHKASFWIAIDSAHRILRPLTSVESMAAKIDYAYNCPTLVQPLIDKAYEWVVNDLNWDKIALQWKDILKIQ